MTKLLYLQGNTSQYPLNRRLGDSQDQSGCCGKKRKYLAPLKNQNPISSTIQSVTHQYTYRTILTPDLLHIYLQNWCFRKMQRYLNMHCNNPEMKKKIMNTCCHAYFSSTGYWHLGTVPDHLPFSWHAMIGCPSIMNSGLQLNWITSPAL
jgi:hypothetical protein